MAGKIAPRTAGTIVIADTSPIIGLSLIGGLDWLEPLFGSAHITRQVREELLFNVEIDPRPGMTEIERCIRKRTLKVIQRDWKAPLFAHLDDGEASVLRAAANQKGACLVIIDESLGRRAAAELGVVVTGLVGLILAAKKARLIPKIAPVLERLEQAQFRLSARLIVDALGMAGEGVKQVMLKK